MTLVDVVNYHKKAGVPVPELLAIHYTVKMLLHIECLHWHGKILHCDVKPDNCVLTPLNSPDGDKDKIFEEGDLMLVDFGRANDLTRFTVLLVLQYEKIVLGGMILIHLIFVLLCPCITLWYGLAYQHLVMYRRNFHLIPY